VPSSLPDRPSGILTVMASIKRPLRVLPDKANHVRSLQERKGAPFTRCTAGGIGGTQAVRQGLKVKAGVRSLAASKLGAALAAPTIFAA